MQEHDSAARTMNMEKCYFQIIQCQLLLHVCLTVLKKAGYCNRPSRAAAGQFYQVATSLFWIFNLRDDEMGFYENVG